MSVKDQPLVLDAERAAILLRRIARSGHPGRQAVYWAITRLWLGPERTHVTYTPSDEEQDVLDHVVLPEGVVSSHRYTAVYRDPVTKAQVIVRTNERPRKSRTLKTSGGKRRFTRIALQDSTKEIATMAKKAAASKGKKSAKADVEDELEEELAGLEEIDDEEDEDVEPEEDDEESEDEDESDEDDDDADDYDSMTNAALKALCKERGIKGIDKANKAKLVSLLEAADEAGDEEDEDEEEEDDTPDFDSMDRAELKAYLKEQDPEFKAKKSQTDDDLRALAKGDDEDEDDEEDDEPPAKKKATPAGKGKTSTKSTGKKPGNKGAITRELPKGRYGAEDAAKEAGTDARSVRMYLRTAEGKEQFPKNEELNRYAFTKKELTALVKKLKGRKGSKAAKA